jgi:hypothetical protein
MAAERTRTEELLDKISKDIARKLWIEEYVNRFWYGGGFAIDKYEQDITLNADTQRFAVREEGMGFLLHTILVVTMPDSTKPEIGFVVRLDDGKMIEDWDIRAYYEDLHFYPPLSGYGGCSKWDAVNYQYAAISHWYYGFEKKLELWVRNYTDVNVTLNWWETQYTFSPVLPKSPTVRTLE